jgi:hypothetical protein
MRKKMICPNCGHEGRGLWIRPGSGGLEVLLWLMMIVPGLLYSVWRSGQAYRGCPKCETRMIPGDSPRGQQLRRQFGGS